MESKAIRKSYTRPFKTLGILLWIAAATAELIGNAPQNAFPLAFVFSALLAMAFTTLGLIHIWNPHNLGWLRAWRARLCWLRWLVFLLPPVFLSWIFLYSSWSQLLAGFFTRMLFFSSAVLFMGWLATQDHDRMVDWTGMLMALMLLGGGFMLSQQFQKVVNYPFSLYWSEGNRFWDYSVLYGRSIYLYPADKQIQTYIDPVRQSLWGLPFLFCRISIQSMRLWNALLFTVPYLFLGWFIYWPRAGNRRVTLFFGVWAFLMLNQGPIYTPLILAAILVAGARRLPFWLACVMVGLAGGYAALGRFTWLVAPPAWAAMVAIVSKTVVSNTPARDDQNNIDHPPGFHPAKKGADRWLTTRRKEILQWGQAVLLGLCGLAGGVMIPKLYPEAMTTAGSMASENMASISGISNQVTRQPLLWERLLPNSTYPEGVVVSLILLTAPIVALLVAFVIRSPWKPGLWRWLALAGVLTGFLAMGIVASVKIGGGSNLHNLDMFLIGLLFVCGLALEAGLKDWVLNPGKQPWWVRGLLLVIVIYPFFQGVLQAQPFGVAEPDVTNSELSKLQKIVSYYGRRGPILFIDQRQLLTFGSIQGIPLLPEYEKKRMMDEAMSGNEAYFKPFYSKVYNHSYALIVTEPLQTSLQNEASQFDKENNVWVKWVARPVLCFYAPYDILPNAGILLLRPRVGVLQDSRFSCPVVK